MDRTGKPCHWVEPDLCSACVKHGKMKLGGFEPVARLASIEDLLPGDMDWGPAAPDYLAKVAAMSPIERLALCAADDPSLGTGGTLGESPAQGNVFYDGRGSHVMEITTVSKPKRQRRPRAIPPAPTNLGDGATGSPPPISSPVQQEVERSIADAAERAKAWAHLLDADCVHVVRGGRALCGMPGRVRRHDDGQPSEWPAGHRWIGVSKGWDQILSCPPRVQCVGCFVTFREQLGKVDKLVRSANKTRDSQGRPGVFLPIDTSALKPMPAAPMFVQAGVDPNPTQSIVDDVFKRLSEGKPAGWLVLGIDPGLANLGVFVLEWTAVSVKCLHRETFATAKADGDTEHRLDMIGRHLMKLLDHWKPTLIGHERISGVTVGKEKKGFGNADRGPLLGVVGQIRQAALERGIPCYGIEPASARVAVMGRGNTRGATKKDVRSALQLLTGVKKIPLDQSDAGALAFGAVSKHQARHRPPARKAVRKPRSKGGQEKPSATRQTIFKNYFETNPRRRSATAGLASRAKRAGGT
jgi:Holliday junction resolvasome RuvABC endonuclease subunit